jgi:hypothetical protein
VASKLDTRLVGDHIGNLKELFVCTIAAKQNRNSMSNKVKVEVGQVWKKRKTEVTITRVVKKPRYTDPYCNVRYAGQTWVTNEWKYLTDDGYPYEGWTGWKLKIAAADACFHDCCNGYKPKKKR